MLPFENVIWLVDNQDWACKFETPYLNAIVCISIWDLRRDKRNWLFSHRLLRHLHPWAGSRRVGRIRLEVHNLLGEGILVAYQQEDILVDHLEVDIQGLLLDILVVLEEGSLAVREDKPLVGDTLDLEVDTHILVVEVAGIHILELQQIYWRYILKQFQWHFQFIM